MVRGPDGREVARPLRVAHTGAGLRSWQARLADLPGPQQVVRAAGWDDSGIYQATALVALFNCTGRLEAAAGLPADEFPSDTARSRLLGRR